MSTKSKKPTGKVARTITAVKNIAKRLTAGKTVAVKKEPIKNAASEKNPASKSTKPKSKSAPKPVPAKQTAKPAKAASKKPIRTVPAIPGKVTAGKADAASMTVAASGTPRYSVFDQAKNGFIPVPDAKPITLPGFEGISLFLHKGKNDIRISEASSGGLLATGHNRKVAVQMATDLLNNHGIKTILTKIQESINRLGAAPGFVPPTGVKTSDKPAKEEPKEEFEITTDDGKEIKVTFTPGFMNHLEFRGEISPTGYHSFFGYKGSSGEAKDAARIKANELRAAFLKGQAKESRKAKKARDAAASKADQPAKAPKQAGETTTGRGGKPRGKMSLLDAAVEVLKEAKQPLCCKDIIRAIFEQKLAESSGRTPQAPLSAAIGREITAKGKDCRFKRADRGQYALNL